MEKLKFNYIKAPQHLEIKADGAIGGPTPAGGLAVSIYTERQAIPQVIVQRLEGGELGDEILDEREGKDGIVRVVQATLHMSIPQARAIQEWLAKNIAEIELKIRGLEEK